MLPLTPLPPQTDGERAFFSELVRWDTGNAIRGAVVAAIPFADGPLQRRLSDAVLFVPEGIAVVRVAEVVRQSGVVNASPEGPWTIGPAGTGGAVLQLAGGGSTPLDGLMRAGMETAMRLRRAGLEPGRIARVTVLTGAIEGLLPADGDLGEGDQVALLETRSLLLGIARASRYTGVDNPRLWTTADVRAALEALGLQGRGPSVEELNGEGFPYSPYVLRRSQLLTPAAMAATPAAAAPGAPPAQPAPVPQPPTPQQPPAQPAGPTRESIEQAVAASVAAAHAAAAAQAAATPQPGGAPSDDGATNPVATAPPTAPGSPAAPPSPPVTAAAARPAGDTVAIDGPSVSSAAAAAPAPAAAVSARDTVAVDGPSEPPSGDAGIGGLFAGAEPDLADAPPGTAVLPAQQPPATAATAEPATQHFWDRTAEQDDSDPDRPGRTRRTLLVLAAVLVLALIGVGLSLALAERDGDGGTAAPTEPAEPVPTGPAVGSVQQVGGVSYTLRAAEVDETCVGNAYGDTATFFETSDCTGLSRALYSGQVGGREVVVSVARVRMPDTVAARELRGLTDTSGSGNVSDLLREGLTYPGGPEELGDEAEYASAVSGPTVTIVESAWVRPSAGGTDAEVDQVATSGLSLTTPPLPAD
ncbi:hypothetical protein SAMN05660662_2241 [Blastococcus aurantiacus]|uniref:Uncharacterized protein n=1 Tax=Blastococcus aurantiacus TaxID=1550231 RepID=A0A1G7LCQ6_9ACTN|nr:hypothetical protein [Blastococcus aurantiacus]SDF47245.1 hypothetical protein SAMN05660662_2241 [Blastococcus aurantiacus]